MTLPEVWGYVEPFAFFGVFFFSTHNMRDLKTRFSVSDPNQLMDEILPLETDCFNDESQLTAPVKLRVEETIIVGYDQHLARRDIVLVHFCIVIGFLIAGPVLSHWTGTAYSFVIYSVCLVCGMYLWVFNGPIVTLGRAAIVSLGTNSLTILNREYIDPAESRNKPKVTPKLRCCVTDRNLFSLKKTSKFSFFTVRCLEIADGQSAHMLIMFPIWMEFFVGKCSFDEHKAKINEILSAKYHNQVKISA